MIFVVHDCGFIARSALEIEDSTQARLDIRSHRDDPRRAIRAARNWLRASPEVQAERIPGADRVVARYETFLRQLPKLCEQLDLDQVHLTHKEYVDLVVAWQRAAPKAPKKFSRA